MHMSCSAFVFEIFGIPFGNPEKMTQSVFQNFKNSLYTVFQDAYQCNSVFTSKDILVSFCDGNSPIRFQYKNRPLFRLFLISKGNFLHICTYTVG